MGYTTRSLALAACLLAAPLPAAAQPPEGASARQQPAAQDGSRTSLDWAGTYTGIVPCADCEGIETAITLSKDLTFVMKTRYLGKEDTGREVSGTFEWDQAGGSITLHGVPGGPARYLVGERRLVQLDREGNRITGDLADHYVLRQAGGEPSSLPEELFAAARWRLTELYGKPIEPAADPRSEPYLSFVRQDSRVQGFAGCNLFNGRFEHAGADRLRFGNVAATMKACADMTVEGEFLKALTATDSFALKDGTLSLHRARMAPLARFEAVAAPPR
ncbi:MAG: protein of unknown function Meta and HslJ [Acidobacteria bacterium]|nr:protein of unknown function Meta and HslJ [Acidobacteriota bacterium]